MMYFVYLHIKNDNGMPFYVGKGCGNRANSKYKRSKWWNNVTEKHGFDVVMLEENITEEKAFELEKYWIKRIGRKHLNNGPLINLTGGGDGSTSDKYISEEFRKKCSLRMIGSKINLGKKHSESVNKLKGKKMGENAKAKEIVYNGVNYSCIKELYNSEFKKKWSYSNFCHRIRMNKDI